MRQVAVFIGEQIISSFKNISTLKGDNLNLKQEEAALLEWTSNSLLSDESSEDVNDVDHNPYNQSHETNDWMVRSFHVHPHFNSPLLSPPPPPHPPPPLPLLPHLHLLLLLLLRLFLLLDSTLVLYMTTDDKPRLRWTQELHEHFVEYVGQLGGPFDKKIT